MRRDPLELADDSLFIEIIKNECTAADTFLLKAANSLLKERTFGFNPTPFQAIDQTPDRDADASTIPDAFLAPLIFQDLFNPGEIGKQLVRMVTAKRQDPSAAFILRRADLRL